MKIGILGAGSWGITLGILLHKKGFRVTLYEHRPEKAELLRKVREDRKRLPGIRIPDSIGIVSDIEAVFPCDYVLFAVPSHTVREVAREIAHKKPEKVVSAVKGLEVNTLQRMSQVLRKELGNKTKIAVLSGPSIAIEVAQEQPTSVVVAAEDEKFAEEVQMIFHTKRFRVYRSTDVIGVELGGALKNIIAIGAGVVDGMGFGANAKGALITRGLAEIMRLGVALGADPLTFSGLAGVGDLITTCFSKHSRNRYVGEELGKGRRIDEILRSMNSVAEGVRTTEAAYRLSRKTGVEMPVTWAIRSLLRGKMSSLEILGKLLDRHPKKEIYWSTQKEGL